MDRLDSLNIASSHSRSDRADLPACIRCRREVLGRRRNGFCSDSCRMAARRERDAARRAELLANLLAAVEAVRRELLSELNELPEVDDGGR